MNSKAGNNGTFIVKIIDTQNSTWQGTVTWVENNQTIPFRSGLELILMIDSTLSSDTLDVMGEEAF